MIRLSDDEQEELIATRRDLHRHPEIAFEEVRTSGLVADRLRSIGLTPRTGIGGTGVTALLDGRKPGKRVLLRADMDALPVHELNDVPYRSTVDGKMHACGHDGHTAIALTTARVLKRLEPPEKGSILFLFQPAEEIADGAKKMIAEGVLRDPVVDAAFGLHLWSVLDTGKIGVAPGPFMAAADEFEILVTGKGCHGARPQEGRDPVLAAAHIVTALQQIAARLVDPLDSVVITVGSIHGGDAFNVIPGEVMLKGTARSFSEEVWDELPEQVSRIAEQTAAAFGCNAKATFDRSARPLINDPEMTALVREVATEAVGAENVVEFRNMAAEDFGEYLVHVPGCFFFVGARNERQGHVHPHHSPRFDLDEAALPLGVQLLAEIARRYLVQYA